MRNEHFPHVESHSRMKYSFGSAHVMDRHGNYNNERLLEYFSFSILNPCCKDMRSWAGCQTRENNSFLFFFFFLQLPDGELLKVYASKIHVLNAFYDTTGTLVQSLMNENNNKIKD